MNATPTRQSRPPEITENTGEVTAATAPASTSPSRGPAVTTMLFSALNRQSVIVEMTPQFREQFEPDWTFDNIKALIGRQVKIAGQLLIDNEHNIRTQNCGLPGADQSTCWRASAWELHPVTQFWVCPTDSCEVDGTAWVSVQQASAKD